jgi:hypothetical protein
MPIMDDLLLRTEDCRLSMVAVAQGRKLQGSKLTSMGSRVPGAASKICRHWSKRPRCPE